MASVCAVLLLLVGNSEASGRGSTLGGRLIILLLLLLLGRGHAVVVMHWVGRGRTVLLLLGLLLLLLLRATIVRWLLLLLLLLLLVAHVVLVELLLLLLMPILRSDIKTTRGGCVLQRVLWWRTAVHPMVGLSGAHTKLLSLFSVCFLLMFSKMRVGLLPKPKIKKEEVSRFVAGTHFLCCCNCRPNKCCLFTFLLLVFLFCDCPGCCFVKSVCQTRNDTKRRLLS